MPVASRSTSQPPLTLTEAAAHLNVRPRFMRRLVAERRLPYHKVGALLRFRLEDLDAYFTSRRVEASSAVRRRSA